MLRLLHYLRGFVLPKRMKIGIGTEDQFVALREAGAEIVRTHESFRTPHMSEDILFEQSFRPDDTILLVQSNLLSFDEIKRIAKMVSGFEVPKCGVFKLETDKAIRLFRQLRPDLEGVKRADNRHGQIKYPQPSFTQVQRILHWWHSDLDTAVVLEKVGELLGTDVPRHWVRDQVKKATSSAARDPDAKGKKPYDPYDTKEQG